MPIGDEIYADIGGERVRVVREGAQVVLADLDENSTINVRGLSPISGDAAGRVRISNITTLGDYKILDFDSPFRIETVSTGSGSYGNNKYTMEVASGQYVIRQTRRVHPYFSGKSQLVEITFDNFHLQSGVTKRVGYFSSTGTSPYTGNYDGFWLENDGTEYRLVISRNGVETANIPMTSWDNYSKIDSYNWQNFTVIMFDFLWLGGALLRFWLKTNDGFVLAHTVNYAGTSQDTFTRSPNQRVRCEIRGLFGSGIFRYICSQVATEGTITESGISRYVDTGSTLVSAATIGTTYVIKAIRKSSSLKDIAVDMEQIDLMVGTNQDQLRWTVQINPTLSGALTWTGVTGSAVEESSGTVRTVTSPGIVIAGGSVQSGVALSPQQLKYNFLSWLGGQLDGTQDIYALCVTPLTANCTLYGGIGYKEY